MSRILRDDHRGSAAGAGESRLGPSILMALLSAVWSISTVGIISAVVGRFSWSCVLGIGSIAAILLFRFVLGHLETSSNKMMWILALVIAGMSVMVNSKFPAEHLLTGRDAGTYVATAGWLALHGELPIEVRSGPFAYADDLSFGLLGFTDDRADGRLSPKFLHTFPALMALAAQVESLDLALRVNAALGGIALLGVFAFASRLMRSGFALLVEAALAVNLVFVYYSRAPFSEMLAMVFAFGGLWMLSIAGEKKQVAFGFSAGLMIGGSLLARIDGLVLAVALVAVTVAFRWRSSSEHRFWGWVVGGTVLMGGIAAADLLVVDPSYIGQLRSEIASLLVAVVVLIGADLVLHDRHARCGMLLERNRLTIERAIAGAVALAAAFAYFIRPHLFEAAGSVPNSSLASIQRAQGLPVEPLRTYAEWSAHWLGWYMGPIVAVAVLGWAVLAGRTATARNALIAPFVLILSIFTLFYGYRPSINPDQIWAMRRFLPIVIPGLLVCAGWALDQLLDVQRVPSWASRGLVAALGLAMVAAPLHATAHLAGEHEFAGLSVDFQSACAELGGDAAVLIVDVPGAPLGPYLVQGFRSFCNIPAAYVDGPLLASRESELSDAWAADGMKLWLLSRVYGESGVVLFDRTYQEVERTLTYPPRAMEPIPLYVRAKRAG